MERFVLGKYHEIALKRKNRPMFQRALLRAIRGATRGLGVRDAAVRQSRVVMDLDPKADWQAVRYHLKGVFGLTKFSLAYRLPADIEALKQASIELLPAAGDFTTFRVRASRNDKSFPLRSNEIEREVGGVVKMHTGKTVNLSQADLTVYIEIVPGAAYLYLDEEAGAGGLPTGASGKVMCLLSGGIDSPVAAYRLMRRGTRATFVHFHAFPVLWGVSRDKAQSLVETLNRYQLRSRLHLVPFASIQQRLLFDVPPRYRVVVYRRLMLRIAEALARREGAQALVTGESLGQVSSQTLENLYTIDGVARMPVLRPLIGMDKVDIIRESRRLGTYEISIQPDEDCCTLFVPGNPVTRSTPEELARIESALDIDALVQMGVDTAELRRYEYNPETEPAGV